MEKLKPCPFCGGEATLYNKGLTTTKIYAVVCPKCKVQYPFVFADEDMAIEAWNKRAETHEERTERRKPMSEIIRCKDCRYWGEGLTEEQKDVVRKLPVLDLVCSWWESDGCCPDDFCSNAKPMPKEGEYFDAAGCYDEVEEIPNCTVQILRNSDTGETSVGWWRNE